MNKITKENNAKELGYYFDIIERNAYTVEALKKSGIFEGFLEALYRFIADNVFNACSNRALLRSLEYRFGNDIAEDLQMDALLNLFAEIKHGKNKGKVRLDMIFEKDRAYWEGTIFTFVHNNILLDLFKYYAPDSLDRLLYDDDDASDKALGDILPSGENIEEDVLFGFAFQQLLKALLVDELTSKPVSVAYIGFLNNLADSKANKTQRFAHLLCTETPEDIVSDTITKFVNEFNIDITDANQNMNFDFTDLKINYNDFRRYTVHIDSGKLPSHLSKEIHKEKQRIRKEYEFLFR